jgi:hypothetical protein
MTSASRIFVVAAIIGIAATLAACGGGGSTAKTPTATPSSPTPAASTATPTATAVAPTATPLSPTPATPTATAVAPAVTPSPVAAPPPSLDPCTLRVSLEGGPLSAGPSFALDANTMWQLCLGGVAAGSGEKYLFRTTDGGESWTLISRTTLGNPTPEAGVGDLPNGNGVTQILFLDATDGWMGLNSPGVNLFRSQDGGVTWTPVPVVPSAVPVTSISFTDAMHGTVVTPEGTWTTSDGGETWTP